jgi:hypothetical protein
VAPSEGAFVLVFMDLSTEFLQLVIVNVKNISISIAINKEDRPAFLLPRLTPVGFSELSMSGAFLNVTIEWRITTV